jgi:hypothetical protein
MKRRGFLSALIGLTIGTFITCKKVFGRWWHGRYGDINHLASHMRSSNHEIPYQMLAGLSYIQVEQWHEADHRKYGSTPARYRLYKLPRKTIISPRKLETLTKKKSKRLYIINNTLVYK